jgi:hypothetical protein
MDLKSMFRRLMSFIIFGKQIREAENRSQVER